jgi:hypothetical protein
MKISLLTLLVLLLGSACAMNAQPGTALSSNAAMYARVVRLSHNANASNNGQIIASVTAFPNGNAEEDIYASKDGGATFTQVGAVQDPDFAGGLCCGELYELPSAVGQLAPGTLLWAGSVGQTSTSKPMQIKVYQSTNQGATWTYLSNAATAASPDNVAGGLWEPNFTIAADGSLVCFYSDETVPNHSQLIQEVKTTNGITWSASSFAVASGGPSDRPGMAEVTKVTGGAASGEYFMTFELCGPANCTVFFKMSPDGWNWNFGNMGWRVQTALPGWFQATPTNTWAPSATSPDGLLMVTGQTYWLNGPPGVVDGATIFTLDPVTALNSFSNTSPPNWNTMPAPVAVTDVDWSTPNSCQNYSSPLLPSADGSTVLEFASDYVGTTCTMFYATGVNTTGTSTSSVTVTPAHSSTPVNLPLSVTVDVTGSVSGVQPNGTVTLTSGSYSSGPIALSGGAATITIPGNALAMGSATLTANYSGDNNYASSNGNSTVTVTASVAVGFNLSTTSVSIAPGATTGNTSTITLTPINGFTGNVALSAQITQSPAGALYLPTLSFGSTSPVSITGITPVNATLTISTVSAVSAALHPEANGGSLFATGGATLACLLLFGLPARRRNWLRNLLLLGSITILAGTLMGCAGKGGKAGVMNIAGTTPGSYTIQVTGVSGSDVVSNTLTLTVQ